MEVIVLTRLFSEFDDVATISEFLLSRVLYLLEPEASEQMLLEKTHLATLWYILGWGQLELQTFGCSYPNQRLFGEDWWGPTTSRFNCIYW